MKNMIDGIIGINIKIKTRLIIMEGPNHMTSRNIPVKRLYIKLFTSVFVLSLFTFGGGYVIITMMKKKFVDELGWLEEKEMLDIIAIAQSAPGIIAVNASVMLGYRLAKIRGALICVLGTILPPLIVMTGISFIYEAIRDDPDVRYAMLGLRAGIAAVMTDAVIKMAVNTSGGNRIFTVVIMIAAFLIGFVTDMNKIGRAHV